MGNREEGPEASQTGTEKEKKKKTVGQGVDRSIGQSVNGLVGLVWDRCDRGMEGWRDGCVGWRVTEGGAVDKTRP